MRSDEELMAAYVAGDRSSFDELFRRYAPVLLAVLQRQIRSPQDARDLVQQTFLQLHRARRDFDQKAKLRPWIFTIALNLRREYFRRQKRRPEAPLELDGRSDPAVPPHDLTRDELARTVRHAIDQLPAAHQEVIVLHWFEGLSFPEISEIVGASLSAVKVRAHRGYVALRKVLSASPAEGRRPQTEPSASPAEGRRPQTEPSASPAEGRRPQTRPFGNPSGGSGISGED
jgi:RNA polymerase sigma-70 factor, ECF subfamily